MEGNAELAVTVSESRFSEVSPAGVLVGVSGQRWNWVPGQGAAQGPG